MAEKKEPSKLLCKDCKHSYLTFDGRMQKLLGIKGNHHAYKCQKSLKDIDRIYNPVTGIDNSPKNYHSCMTARDKFGGACGVEGSMWEPREKKDLFLMLTEK